jgi:simple sugar transport system substrate-binding protein
MSELELFEPDGEAEGGVSRRGLLSGGLLAAAGAGLLGPAAATAARASSKATLPIAGNKVKIGMVTHGDAGSFWSVAKKGAVKAGHDLGVEVLYSESDNDPKKQADLINTAISKGISGLAVSAPNPDALKSPLKKATGKNIPIVTLNSGSDVFKQLGAFTHVGQTETIAGAGAGERLKAAGLKKLLVIIHEQSNIGLEQRYSGAKSKFGSTVRLQVAGTNDISTTTTQIQTKLASDHSIDAVLALNPDIAAAALDAAKKAHSKAKIATFDLSGDVVSAIAKGDILFAVDQQQYVQGYLPVVLLYLYDINLNTTGGGLPVLTGPGFVDKSNASKVAALAKAGTR